MSEQKSTSSRHSANFQPNWTTLTFLAQICPKRKLGFEIQKTNVGIRISIFEIPCVPIFRQNEQLWFFGPKFAQKWILGSKFQKSMSGFGISILEILSAPIFKQNGQLWIFEPKFAQKWILRLIIVISMLKLFVSFSPPHTNTQILLSAHGYLFQLSQPFSRIFFPIKPT